MLFKYLFPPLVVKYFSFDNVKQKCLRKCFTVWATYNIKESKIVFVTQGIQILLKTLLLD